MQSIHPRAVHSVALVVATLLIASCSVQASLAPSSRDDTRPADAWLNAIEAQDWEAMHALLAEDAVYEDPTAADEAGAPLRFEGRDAIVGFWRSSSADSGAQDIRYRIDDRFESGGVTVFSLWLTIGVAGEYWNVDTDLLRLEGRQVTVVTVRDDRVVRVADHVDYDSARERIDALREEHGALTSDD